MKKYAFFDVDKTIYKGYSENDFLNYVEDIFPEKKPMQRLAEVNRLYIDGIMGYNEAAEIVTEIIGDVVKGQKVSYIEKLLDDVYSDNKNFFEDWFFPIYETLKDAEFKIVLISASSDFVISRVAKKIDENIEYYSTEWERKNNTYTGKHFFYMNDKKKREVIDSIKSEEEFYSIAFGDSPGDIPMLEGVNKAFVFSQKDHPYMSKVAKEKDWKIFEKDKEIYEDIKDIII